MATCHLCGKNLGWGIFSRWEVLDGHRFCPDPCAAQWYLARRERAMAELCRDGDPVEIFRLPNVRTRDLDKPGSRTLLLGVLSFMDKGVAFVQIAEARKAETAGWFLVLGWIGLLIADGEGDRKRKEAYADGKLDILDYALNFREVLEAARQLVVYPLDQITKIGFRSGMLDIRMGKHRKRYAYDGGRKVYKQFRPVLEAYARASQTGADPALECTPLLAGLPEGAVPLAAPPLPPTARAGPQ